MKFYQKRGFALVVLILAIIGSGVYGISKKPAALPEVSYYNWICDEAGLLDQETRQTIQDYNTAWNKQYYAVVAVAAVDDIRGWSSEDYARELGARWGLGANDMLLLLVKGGDWYVACGDDLADQMTDTQQTRLKTALDTPYYAGDYSQAAVDFFRQSDVVLAQTLGRSSTGGQSPAPGPALAGACRRLRRQHRRCGAADHVHIRGLGAAGPYALQPLSPASGYDGRAGVLSHFLGPQAPGAPAAPSPSGSRRSHGWTHGRRSPSAPAHTAPSAPV